MSDTAHITSIDSPFSTLEEREVERIYASQTFQSALKEITENNPSRTCFISRHSEVERESRATWLFHHTILRLSLAPLLRIFDVACAAASTALHTRRVEKYELAFVGDARGAFGWLQCLMADEMAWLMPQAGSCIVCPVQHILSSDSTLRAIMTAVLLSTTPENNVADIDLSPILPALRKSLETDEFWGPYHYEHILVRAENLQRAISLLERQIESLDRAHAGPLVAPRRSSAASLIKIRPSSMELRQWQLRDQETALVAEFLWGWFVTEERRVVIARERKAAVTRAGRRSRILTAP